MEKRYKVPAGMLKAAGEASGWMPWQGVQQISRMLEAAIRWLAENPIVPTMKQERALDDAWMESKQRPSTLYHRFEHASAFGAVEWQCRMFLEPEPEIPEAVKDLLWDGSNDLEDESNNRILEAYRRGQQEKAIL